MCHRTRSRASTSESRVVGGSFSVEERRPFLNSLLQWHTNTTYHVDGSRRTRPGIFIEGFDRTTPVSRELRV